MKGHAEFIESHRTLREITVGKIVEVSGSTVVAHELQIYPPSNDAEVTAVTHDKGYFHEDKDMPLERGLGYMVTTYIYDHRMRDRPDTDLTRDVITRIQTFLGVELPE